MAEDISFVELVRNVRAGDEVASAELVRRYEPAIRIAVRGASNRPRLRRLFDSMDICQSVFAIFFVRAAAGEYELDRPERLIQLLATMARNRVTDHVRGNSEQPGETIAGLRGPPMTEDTSSIPTPVRVTRSQRKSLWKCFRAGCPPRRGILPTSGLGSAMGRDRPGGRRQAGCPARATGTSGQPRHARIAAGTVRRNRCSVRPQVSFIFMDTPE